MRAVRPAGGAVELGLREGSDQAPRRAKEEEARPRGSSAAAKTQRPPSGPPPGDSRRRVPPSDLDAEKAVLSAILLDNNAIHGIVTEIEVESFYHPAHQALYRAMLTLKDQNQPVDLVTLADYLKSNDLLESVGGVVALAEIADYEATSANIIHYARIVREKSVSIAR